MKKLDFAQFGDIKQKVFSQLWIAYRATYPKMASGYENMKLCNRIGEALEAISEEAPATNDATERKLKVDALLIESMEFAKLLAMVKSEEIGWTHTAGKTVEKLIAAMEAAPDVKVEEKA